MMSNTDNPYKFTIKGTTFDFYDLSDAIGFEQSAVEHAAKKLVALGKRSGNKSYGQDLHEAIMSLLRAQEQYNESLRSTAGSMGAVTSGEKSICTDTRPRIIAPCNPKYLATTSAVDTGGSNPISETSRYANESIEDAIRYFRSWGSIYKE
jgi:hypothetical protein